ncbi:ROK family protein [Saccharomonospora piscinae]|uniref:ROK family protein n=1 Tax=Saccharomonospora piscinae TaxID=687388 RepID=UPI003CC5BAB5
MIVQWTDKRTVSPVDRHSPASPRQQHDHNLALVSRLVAEHGPASRAGLASHSGLTKTTVAQLAGELIDAGLVRELGTARTSGPGRPATHLVLNSSGPVGIGLQIEADHVAGCLFDLGGRVRDRALRRAEDLRGDPAAAVKAAEPVLRRLLASAAARDTVVAGVTAGVPGTVTGDGRASSRELGWTGAELSRLLTRRIAELSGGTIPVAVRSAFRLAALAQRWFGESPPSGAPVVVVSGELSLGAAVTSAGDAESETDGHSGELGHVRVRARGARCRCGRRGCLDTVAGPRTLLAGLAPEARAASRLVGGDRLRRLLPTPGSGGGDAVVRPAASALADALAGTVLLVGPAPVVVGGALALLGPAFADRVAAELEQRCPGACPAVSVSRLDGDAVARAAAASVTRRLVEEPARWLAS